MNWMVREMRWHTIIIAAWLLLVMAVMGLQKSARLAPVAIVVEYGTILPHDATARLRVTIDPQKLNRGLWVAIESTGYASAHYEQLAGAQAPKTRWVEFADLPDGNYTAWARLLKERGETSASATFIVGQGEELFQ